MTSNNLRDGNPFSRFVVFVEFPSGYASLEHFFSKKEVSVDFSIIKSRIVTHGELYEKAELRGIEFVSMLHDDSDFFQRQVLMTVEPCEHVLIEIPVLRRGRVAWHR
jgi:hypothetical protein